ncbi:MAG: PSD1 and planctomycete cytochrome C domain-containing protein [Pirellulales bacterium]|nr:PSD1 and planctomycete cytochrome C domain-containing protein [Pirellulales bacterium]
MGNPKTGALPAVWLIPAPAVWLIPAVWLVLAIAPAAAQDLQAERDFTLKVLPVLKAKCFGCHGDDADDLQGELDVRSRQALLAGGESGDPSIIPGNAEDSPLMLAVNWDGLEMPPKENDRLTAEQIDALGKWIQAGAPWPDAKTQAKHRQEAWSVQENEDGVLVTTSGGTSGEWTYRRYQAEDLWAFRPVAADALVAEVSASRDNPVDHFINKKLAAAGAQPAPMADPRTLIRRASFDLIGLPPTPEQVTDFLEAWEKDSHDAWSALIERLLESPHYGERWGQHWLDVTRYADTGGMSNDYERSNMWRYRDYVIRALNQDKPYDRFIIEQLAGDELADQSVLRRSGGDQEKVFQTQLSGDYSAEEAEWIVATGFLRNGPWDNAMVDAEEARQIYLDDVVNVVGQTFLSTTMRCVKCHDHKFDPIPTRDYYRMYAAFAATRMAERPVPFLEAENRAGMQEGEAHVRRMLAFAVAEKNRLVEKRETAARKWFEERGLPYKNDAERKSLPDDEKPPRHVGLDHVDEGQLKVREQDEWIWNRRLERYQPMAQSVYNATGANLAWNGARKLRIDKKADRQKRPESYVLIGGALTALGDRVGPGVLSATGLMVDSAAEDPYLIADAVAGRRLALARWIAHPENPLTARSIVNRIWQHHFGRGIAANANNFGAKGGKPTHPELLDYLAADFVQHGWKIKRMHRLIMMSDVYRQSSQHPHRKQLRTTDPNNELWAYFPARRLTAEELRDAMLSTTEELNREVGGLPVMPEINLEVALQPRMIQFSLAPAYQPSPTPEQRNRRTVYAYRVRGQADPFLELFNLPNPNESCERRDTASVTPQVFTLLNSDMVTDRSIAMALRLESEAAELDVQIKRAFELTLGRQPTPSEHQRMKQYVRDMRQYHAAAKVDPVSYPTEITRSLVEEFSGKVFEYTEILPVFGSYQPDKKAADVTPHTRALADLCLLLFNANEFIYIP